MLDDDPDTLEESKKKSFSKNFRNQLNGGPIKVFVKKGEKVFSNQNIGEVFTNKSTGKSSVQFSVFDKTTPVNPQLWLLKK